MLQEEQEKESAKEREREIDKKGGWRKEGQNDAKLTWKRKRKIYDFNLYCQVS